MQLAFTTTGSPLSTLGTMHNKLYMPTNPTLLKYFPHNTIQLITCSH